METFEFGPGEEKLAKAFEKIVAHEKFILRLSQRIEVDALVISLLLDELQDPAATLRNWQSKMASYYPNRAVDYLGKDLMEMSSEELNNRVSLWTRALEARAQEEDQD